jgi:hypothetical protein
MKQERRPEAYMSNSIIEPIHIEAGRMQPSIFTVLRGSEKVDWGVKQQKVFDDLKNYLEHLPMLSSIEEGQPIILYISAMHLAVSRALVIEKETIHNNKIAKQQLLMYFVSKVLTGSKKLYSEVEKIVT